MRQIINAAAQRVVGAIVVAGILDTGEGAVAIGCGREVATDDPGPDATNVEAANLRIAEEEAVREANRINQGARAVAAIPSRLWI